MGDRHRLVAFAVLLGCGAAPAPPVRLIEAPPAPPAPPIDTVAGPPLEAPPTIALTARVFTSRDQLGPLAARLDPAIALDGRALVLAGDWLPPRAARVVVIVVEPDAPVTATIGRSETVTAEVIGGALVLHFEHDVNVSGYCCSGVGPGCDGHDDPPMPPRPGPDDPVVLFSAPISAVTAGVAVRRTISICTRA